VQTYLVSGDKWRLCLGVFRDVKLNVWQLNRKGQPWDGSNLCSNSCRRSIKYTLSWIQSLLSESRQRVCVDEKDQNVSTL